MIKGDRRIDFYSQPAHCYFVQDSVFTIHFEVMKSLTTAILLILVMSIVQAQDSATMPDRRIEELGKHYEALREHSSLVLDKIQHESRILLFKNNVAVSKSGLETVQALLHLRTMQDAIQKETEEYFFAMPDKNSDCNII